jgi:hypothetical protein
MNHKEATTQRPSAPKKVWGWNTKTQLEYLKGVRKMSSDTDETPPSFTNFDKFFSPNMDMGGY